MGTKEYHAQKSREHYQRMIKDPEWKEKKRIYYTQRRAAKKGKYVKQFGGICAHCKQVFPDCVFEFHHINHETKDRDPSKLFGLTDEKIEQELAKCIMLCANCHRIEHDKLKYDAHAKRHAS